MTPAREPDAVDRGLGVFLAAGRMAIGAAIWLAPRQALPALGFERAADDDEALTLARIAATRDVVLGAWQASALGNRARLRRATLAVAACDAADALAFAIAARHGARPALAAKGLAGAVPATLAGAWLAARLGSTGN
jgi:hypothetical protein